MSLEDKIEQIKDMLDGLSELIKSVEEEVSNRNKDIRNKLYDLISNIYPDVNIDDLDAFLKEPYAIIPRKEDEWLLVVPKFVTNMNLGYLFQESASYRVFVVNRWIGWLYDIPDNIRRELGLERPVISKVYLDDTLLKFPEELTDTMWLKYRKFVYKRIRPGIFKIKRNAIPELMLKLVRDGIIPYKLKPIPKDLLIDRECKIELRDYQKEAYELFLKYGSLGLFWPPGAGKMFLALYIMTKMGGRKLIIVPTRSLVEEWERKIKSLTPIREDEYEIITYNLVNYPRFREIEKENWSLIVMDESQHIPANSFIKLAWLRGVGRLSLSASPYREDGREDIIFALSGYFQGIDWNKFIGKGIIRKPTIEVIIVPDYKEKMKLVEKMVAEKPKKVLIFSDSIDVGEEISRRLKIPFVYGSTRRRLQVIEENDIVAISRVGDEGIDIPSVRTIIEVSFLYGSRRQQLQRVGRILHSRYKGYYAILMTKEEYNLYRKRLFSVIEKGFSINIVRKVD